MADSPRWCDVCKAYGDHHTDRCPKRLNRRYYDPLKERDVGSAFEACWGMALMFMVLGALFAALTGPGNPEPIVVGYIFIGLGLFLWMLGAWMDYRDACEEEHDQREVSE